MGHKLCYPVFRNGCRIYQSKEIQKGRVVMSDRKFWVLTVALVLVIVFCTKGTVMSMGDSSAPMRITVIVNWNRNMCGMRENV